MSAKGCQGDGSLGTLMPARQSLCSAPSAVQSVEPIDPLPLADAGLHPVFPVPSFEVASLISALARF